MKRAMSQKIGILFRCKRFSIPLLIFLASLTACLLINISYLKIALLLLSMTTPIILYSAIIVLLKDEINNE